LSTSPKLHSKELHSKELCLGYNQAQAYTTETWRALSPPTELGKGLWVGERVQGDFQTNFKLQDQRSSALGRPRHRLLTNKKST